MGEKGIQVRDFIRVFLGVCLLLINVLAGLVGLAVVGITTWLYIIEDSFPFYFHQQSDLVMITSLICGAVLFVLALFGILAGILSLFIHPRCQLLARVVIILYSLALLLLYAAGIASISLQWDRFYTTRSDLEDRFLGFLTQRYGQAGSSMVSSSINSIQRSGSCCGYRNGDDYIGSSWLSVQLDLDLRPFSCCASQTASCSADSDDYFGQKGCASLVERTFSLFYWALLAAVVSASFLVFLLLFISTVLLSCLIN